MTNNIFTSALDEQFKNDCKVINLKYEYPGYTGTEQWAIITDLSESELTTRYFEQIAPYKPFIILSESFGNVRDDYRRNEKKHEMRALRHGHAFDFSEETEEHHSEIATPDVENEYLREETYAELRAAIMALEDTQKKRIIKYFFEGKTYKQIAKEEGVSFQAVAKSIDNAVKKLSKFDFWG